MNVYERLDRLKKGDTVFTDLHETLFNRADNSVNTQLVNALIDARGRGVIVALWTGGGWHETAYGVELMRRHGLEFDDVFMNILKPTGLIIDNLGVSP
ncbi:MAG: hypothetical protein FWH16_05895 [Oscillospiraceae bacterium]|nr:hypothetical protein [Oscillospiraceae bacterium]